VDRDVAESRRIAGAAQAAFRTVFTGWDSAPDSCVERAIPAQIAAAALGYKPLYWDPWNQTASRRLARLIRPSLPEAAQIRAAPEGLFVFRTAVVGPILDADPPLYRPWEEPIWPAIRRATRLGINGDLLGYGAPSLLTSNSARVTIRGDRGVIFVYFVSRPEVAARFADERAADLTAVLDETIEVFIEYPPLSFPLSP